MSVTSAEPGCFSAANSIKLASEQLLIDALTSTSYRTPVGAMAARSAELDLQQFISMAAHELREPMQAIQGFLSVLLRERVGPLTPVQSDFLESAFLAGRRLERLVNDLQVMVIGERGFTIEDEHIDLLDHVTACVRELGPVAEGYGITVDVEACGDGPWTISGDPTRIDQIVLNIVENAIRYAAENSIVRVRMRRTTDGIRCAICNVTDTPPSEDPRSWFASFVRGRQTTRNRRPGLGLGLAVVQHLVELHQGRIEAAVRGRQVVIRFELPVRKQPRRLIAIN